VPCFIEVFSLEEVSEVLCAPGKCADVTYLVSIGEPHEELPAGYERVRQRLRLHFADTVAGELSPTREDVRRIIELAETLRSSSGRILVHCAAGISRSSAAALIMHAVWLGPGRERDALERVLAQRPIARPNRRMVELADELLGRDGELVEVLGQLPPLPVSGW
jgi:predicted protein tyrosine phosphatase